jgi:hypothetical protein
MIEFKSSSLFSAFLALVVYVMMILFFIYYFNMREHQKPKHYVVKDEKRITVSLASATSSLPIVKKPIKPREKPLVKKKINTPKKSKVTSKKRLLPKKKKAPVKKVVKKRVIEQTTKDLFSQIKGKKSRSKPLKKSSTKTIQKPKSVVKKSTTLKDEKMRQSGEVDRYKAKVQRLLENWPAQSSYAGEKMKVIFFIKPSGFFTFSLKSFSNNVAFNEGIKSYLKQLQQFGFGPHSGGRTYTFEAEFIAKE